MQINQWISEFLARRGLKHPDERPLFAYKTSTDEFESLKRLLQNYADKFHLSRHYPAAWLLFAAEWWKRDYAGRERQYETVEQMQSDLESYLDHYNTKRAHQGHMMATQTPYSMFKKGLKLIPKEQRVKVA